MVCGDVCEKCRHLFQSSRQLIDKLLVMERCSSQAQGGASDVDQSIQAAAAWGKREPH